MKKIVLVLIILCSSVQAQAPNAASSWTTVCSWDTSPACLVYHVVNGVYKLWSK